METTKNPGIAIEDIKLLSSHVRMVDPKGEKEYDLRLTAFDRVEQDDGKALILHAAFDVMHGIEKPLFNFKCEFIARYTRKDETGMAWKEFASAMALAHIIPYLREYVSNITNRLPLPAPLMLPPINTYAMIEDYEARKRSDKDAKANHA